MDTKDNLGNHFLLGWEPNVLIITDERIDPAILKKKWDEVKSFILPEVQ